ncbi:filamentous hemagglutinin N-terminal domain-containing protein [Tumidithrix elongata RA019]|uniref:Filamentous hemagglutinin N-terminal domain-containing protein n=1 Tax=Tumidithrix elongata BACA0141 TaxID=2716417 RepID=A0AAW9PTS7_9CYAN|nr:filamentous hemagglutinin N-terminal domain-containing protein [Tumidithrix elongata RA019]
MNKTLVGLSVVTIAFNLVPASPARSQVIPDRTLPMNTVVNTNGTTFTITGGTQVGGNQFHSFDQFSVPTSSTAYFNNTPDTVNIISRVTGTSSSNIDGLIKANGQANLFLVNPNGIIFGQNAKLDIGGSFTATTANSIKFSDGTEFSATNPSPLLTLSTPIGLQYGKSNRGATITNQGNLSVGQDLTFVADKLDLQGQLKAGRDLTLQAQDTLKIRDRISDPFIAISGRQMLVQGDRGVDIFALNHPNSGFYAGGDMTLRSANPVLGDAHYYANGNFKIEQLNGKIGDLHSPNDPIVRSLGDVTIGFYIGSSLHILAGGRVTIDTAFITGTDTTTNTINPTITPNLANVLLSNGRTLTINGNAHPTLDIRSGMNPSDIGISGVTGTGSFFDPSLSFALPPPSTSQPSTGTGITIGDILINAPNGVVLLTNNYKPNTFLPDEDITITGTGFFSQNPGFGVFAGIQTFSGVGNGGSVFVDSRGNINANQNIVVGSSAVSGNGGSVTLLAKNDIRFSNDALIFSNAPYLSGQIDLKANGAISGQGLTIISRSLASTIAGNSGDINLTAASLSLTNSLTNPSLLFTGTFGNANAGNITLNISGNANFSGVVGALPTQVISQVEQNASGQGGRVSINAGTLTLLNGAQINSTTNGLGQSGDVAILANAVNIDGRGSAINNQVLNFANANGGNLTVTTNTLSVTNEGQISTITSGVGNAGNLNIIATGNILFDRSTASSAINLGGQGKGGDLAIIAKSLQLLNGGQVGAGVFNIGDGGKITIQADAVSLSGSGSIFGALVDSAISTTVETNTAIGNAGDIDLSTRVLSLSNGAFISAATNGQGNTGNINIRATESVSLKNSNINNFINNTGRGNGGDLSISSPSIVLSDRAKVSTYTAGIGNAGKLNFFAESLSLSDNSQIQAYTDGNGNAGSITIAPIGNRTNEVKIDGSSVSADINFNGRGSSGNISVMANSLQVLNGGQISVGVFGQGNGGTMTIETNTVLIDGSGTVLSQFVNSGLYASVDNGAIGNGGEIKVTTNTFALTNKGTISTKTDGFGNAGEITVFANTLDITSGGKLSAATSTSGQSGNINLNIRDRLNLDGTSSGIFANTTSSSTGKGGNIFIDPIAVSISNGAGISVNSLGTGNGGNIQLFSGSLTFSNGGFITAGTASGEGGNISLNVRDILLMRTGSQINTNAGGSGNGGNIDINAGFVVAVPFENSDISANAIRGRGGNINITTQGIYGLEFRPRLTPLSDITASSDFNLNGTVTIVTPGIDPSKGLNNLPVDVSDASRLVAQSCLADSKGSKFVITGRGGVPANPSELVSGISLLDNLGTSNNSAAIASNPVEVKNEIPDTIVEAQGWVVSDRGQVTLVAKAPAAPSSAWSTQPKCVPVASSVH